jgi:hypothetical protein
VTPLQPPRLGRVTAGSSRTCSRPPRDPQTFFPPNHAACVSRASRAQRHPHAKDLVLTHICLLLAPRLPPRRAHKTSQPTKREQENICLLLPHAPVQRERKGKAAKKGTTLPKTPNLSSSIQNVKSNKSLCSVHHYTRRKTRLPGRGSLNLQHRVSTRLLKRNQALTNLFLLIYQPYMGEYTEAVQCARYDLVLIY